jgi:hypothetical protein
MGFRKARGMSPRFYSQAALVVTILPLWTLWIYAYATLRSLQGEVEALPRLYGIYLYKEHVQSRLAGAVRLVSLQEDRGGELVADGGPEAPVEAWGERFRLLFGPDEPFILMERTGLRILYPSKPPYGSAAFLNEREGRGAFLRTMQRMERKWIRGGYFSIDMPDSPGRSEKRSWFLAVAPVGERLLCVLPVPEERLVRSGGILEEAQANVLKERRRRFVRLTLPVVVLSSLFIGVLYRQARQSGRGRAT